MRLNSRLLAYGVAINSTAIALLTVGIALLISLPLESFLSRSIGAFFYIAIILTTWYGGFRPGIVAVISSTIVIDYFFIPPQHQLWINQPEDVLRLGLFLVTALGINLLTTNLINSQHKIQQLSQKLAQENAQQLRMALSGAQMGLWDWDIVTGEIRWSPENEQLFGLPTGSFDGRYETFVACLHPDDRNTLNQHIKKALQTRSNYQHEYRIVWGDGSIHWVEERGQAFYNEAGRPVRMMGTITAIDERKQAQETLRQSEQRYRALVLASSQIVWHTDAQGSTIAIPEGWEKLTGQSPEKCLKWGWLNLVHPDDRDRTTQSWQTSCTNPGLYETEYRLRMKDGNYRDFISRGVPIINTDGQISEWIGTCTDITERKKAEIVLQEREATLRLFAQYAPAGIAMFDRDMHYVMVSQRWVEEYHLDSIASLIGRSHYEIFPEISEEWRQIHQRCLAGAIQKCDEDLFVRADGSYQWICWEIHPWHTAIGEIGGIIIFSDDITQRKQAQIDLEQLNAELEQRVAQRTEELTKTNDRLLETVIEQQQTQLILLEQAQLLDLAHDTIITRDLKGSISFWNQGAEYLYGWKKAEVLGQISHTLLKTQFPQSLTEIEAELLKKGYWEGELTHFNRDDQPIIVASRWVLQTDHADKPIKILEINNDITERKQAELALQQYVHEVEDLYNNAPCGYHSLDAEGNIIRINNTELNWLGYTRDEILLKKFSDFFTPESKRVFQLNFPKFKQQGLISNLEFKLISKDGTTKWTSLNATSIKDEAGNFVMSRSTVFDITERKQIEDALRESEEKFRQMAENIQAVFWMKDIKTQQVLYVNPAYETIWQRSCASLYQNSSNWLEAIHPEDRQRVEIEFIEKFRTGQYDKKYRIIRPDGAIRWIRDRAFPIRNELGELIRVAGLAEDITELQQVDLIKSEFISIVSHELRTPLTAIRAAMGLLQSGIYDKKPEKFKRMIEIASIDSDRLVRLVNDILDLERLESGRAVLEKTTCQAADLIEQAVAGVKAIAKLQKISFNIHPTNAQVCVAADTIIQTLTNLLGNAIKFSPVDSTITLNVQQQADQILFQITDQGRGIPADKLEAVFGRFQQVDASDSRTKGGTGLGLAICRSIIDQHGGQIWAESIVGVGSTFSFTVPSPPEEIL